MTTSPGAADRRALAALDARLKTLLPEEYQDSYEAMAPVAMRAAGLKYAEDGTVAWDKIWGSFCDLAMAGGPPHKGTLLEPASPAAIADGQGRYDDVVAEICRGITMVTDLPAAPSPVRGWVRVDCYGVDMANWLLRAIAMENVAVQSDGRALDLPAGPAFRLEKEIKNVITVIAKTCHYWLGHMPREQKAAVAALLAELDRDQPLLRPVRSADGVRTAAETAAARVLAADVLRRTGRRASHHSYSGWLGIECPNVLAAVWIMRALVAENILSRREGGTVFLPIDEARDPGGARTARVCADLYRLAGVKGLT